MEIKGIAIPLVIPYRYRGDKTVTLEIYFSYKPWGIEDVDLLEGATTFSKQLDKVLKYGHLKSPLCLIPLDPVAYAKYEAPWGLKFGITPIDSNPTSATLFEKLPFLPVALENASALAKKVSTPFYLSMNSDGFFLHIKKENESGYYSVPSQPAGPKCWVGFAHDHVQLVQKKGNLGVCKFADIPWGALKFLI